MVVDKSISSRIFDLIIHISLFLLLVACLYPLLHVASVSVSEMLAVQQNIITFFPVGFQTKVYEQIFSRPTLPKGFLNSFIYTVVGTFVSLFLTLTMAYALSKKRLPFRNFFMFLVVLTMFFGGGLIPTYLLVRKLGVLDTLWAVIIPYSLIPFNLIIMRTFFQQIPVEMEESAFLDGASDVKVLTSIVIPLSMAAVAVIGLFYMVTHWNAWFPAAIYLKSHAKYPLQLLLREIVILGELVDQLMDEGRAAEAMWAETIAEKGLGGHMTLEQLKYGVLFVSLVPMLIAYPFIQKYFVKGVMIGSVKG